MTEEIYAYNVKCRTCRTTFKVQLFESHEKNLYVADKKDWYCETCKKEYFSKQTEKFTKVNQSIGFNALKGSVEMIAWAEKIRAELINKVDYLKKSLTFVTDDEKELFEKAFVKFLQQWQKETEAKWWIDNRKITVRDISKKIAEISESIKMAS